jgi:hypothetical protein
MLISPPYRFLLRGLLLFAPLWIAALSAEVLLWHVGETVPIYSVQKRMTDDALFLRQHLDQGLYRFKWLSAKDPQSRIVALGTSRVMQFRRPMFGSRGSEFFNAGGMIQHVGDLEAYVAATADGPAPDVVILGVEFVWLNADYIASLEAFRSFDKGILQDDALDGFAHAQLLQRMLKGALNKNVEASVGKDLSEARTHQRTATAPRLGMLAYRQNTGFRSDGSYDYGLAWPDGAGFVDRESPTVAERLARGESGFEDSSGLSAEHVDTLLRSVRSLTDRGTRVLCFLPPYPEAIVDALTLHPGLQQAWRQYGAELPVQLRDAGAVCLDGSRPSQLGLTDTCMRDGLHAMETFHLKLLGRFSKEDPSLNLGFSADAVQGMLDSPKTNPWFPDYRAGEGV